MLKSDSLPAAGNAAHCTPDGLRCWRPAFDTLGVRHLPDGSTTLTVGAPALPAPVLFVLSPEARAHLVRLLLGTDGTPPVPADQLEARDAA